MAANRPSHARVLAAVLPIPHPRRGAEQPGERATGGTPARALVAVALVLAAAAGAYTLARTTSLFAVGTITLRGAPVDVRAAVRAAAAPWFGSSLVGLDPAEVARRVESVPWVERASVDRAFPHTLQIDVRAERAVAVLRRGHERWLVSARGRVLARLPASAASPLPRVWVARTAALEAGDVLPDATGGAAVRALAPLAETGLPVRVAAAALRRGELVFRLRSDVELRLGRPNDLRLKLAIARRILPTLPPDAAYLDVSVPERPVAGAAAANPQVSSGG